MVHRISELSDENTLTSEINKASDLELLSSTTSGSLAASIEDSRLAMPASSSLEGILHK